MRRLALAFALLAAPLLNATVYRFEPPVPDNATTTVVTYTTLWPNGCLPGPPLVDRTGQIITIGFVQPIGACPAIIVPIAVRVNLGVLPAGEYVIQPMNLITEPPTPRDTNGRLVVRDVTTLGVTPPAGPIAGGTVVTISSKDAFDVEPLHVSIGGIELQPVTRVDPHTIQVTTGAHAVGPVDVLVESVMGGSHRAVDAFTFYDPAARTPDAFVFTSILFPVDFAGAGAFGSSWTTDNVYETGGVKTKLPVTGNATGVSVPLLRGTLVSANSRIRDLSRSAQTAGTEIPVVHESDFADRARLLNIPTGANYRALLRVWTMDEPADSFSLNIDQILPIVALQAPLKTAQNGLRFGSFDLTPFLGATANDHLDVTVSVPAGTHVWGMISITNNDTQQVTIVSPH